MKHVLTVFLVLVCFAVSTMAEQQLVVRDDFNRAATNDLSTSPSPLKWVNIANQGGGTISLRINEDMTVSPYNPAGKGNFAGVAWDSLFTNGAKVGIVVRQKSGDGDDASFMVFVRMNSKDLATGDGYRLRYEDVPGGKDRIDLQRVLNGSTETTLKTFFREIAVGDTLVFCVEADGKMIAAVYGIDGTRQWVSAYDNTYNPSSWYVWLRGSVRDPKVKMGDFMIGREKPVKPPTVPGFSVDPTSIDFGSLYIGDVRQDTVLVTNTGKSPLEITSVVSDVKEFLVSPLSGNLLPSESMPFFITFAPDASLTMKTHFIGNIIFSHNAPGSPDSVRVTGTAIPLTSIKPVSEEDTVDQATPFWVSVKVGDPRPVTDLFGISLKLKSNSDWVTYVDGSASAGDFLGSTPVTFFQKVSETTVAMAVSMTSPPGSSGSGIIARAQFTSSKLAGEPFDVVFTLDDIEAVNSAGKPLTLPESLLTVTILPGTCVWPGDLDNNGTVEAADILKLGVFYGAAFDGQTNPGIQWQCYRRNFWPADTDQPARVYADANGDGVINEADLLSVGLNFSKTHTTSSAASMQSAVSGAADGRLTLAVSSLNAAGIYRLNVNVETSKPVYGLAFKVKYRYSNTTFGSKSGQDFYVKATSVEKNIGIFADALDLRRIVNELGYIDVGFTQIRGSGYSGSGSVIVIDLQSRIAPTPHAQLDVEITDIVANDALGNSIVLDGEKVSQVVLGVGQESSIIPTSYALRQNYPNPFNPSTTISIELPEAAYVRLAVYDILGREIGLPLNGMMEAGTHEIPWTAKSAAGTELNTGIYVYRLTASDASGRITFTDIKRMLLVK